MKLFLTPARLVVLFFLAVVVLITGPWWIRPGYVWMLDSVWGPHQTIQWAHPTSNLAWQIVTALLTATLTGPVAEKLVLSLILLSIGLCGYYFLRRLMSPLWAWAGSAIYLLNPFVYERLVAGQWIVLAGYASLPLALALAWQCLEARGARFAYRWAAFIILYPFISPHFAYINVFLTAALVLVFALTRRPKWLWTKRNVTAVSALALAAIAVNWIWLTSTAGSSFESFTSLDFTTFRTASDGTFGVWANVMGLYGFWRGPAFIEPKELLGPIWIAVAFIFVGLAAVGAVRAFRARHVLFMTLVPVALVSLFLAVGFASPISRPVTTFLMTSLPGFRGLRDTDKLTGVLALSYAGLVPYGASWVTDRLPSWRKFAGITSSLLVLLTAISVTGIWADASSQIPIATYPQGWVQVRSILMTTPHASVVVLPWHQYLNLNFAGNAYLAQPAGVFFTNPVISSDEMDNILTARPDNPADRLILAFQDGRIAPTAWAQSLKAQGASYVIVEKTDDGAFYLQQVALAGPRLVYQDSSIALYKLN